VTLHKDLVMPWLQHEFSVDVDVSGIIGFEGAMRLTNSSIRTIID